VLFRSGQGDDIQAVKGEAPPAGFDVWNKVSMRLIAAGAGTPVEVGLGDYSEANFSVARMASMHAELSASVLREDGVDAMHEPVREWRMAHAVINGELPAAATADAIPAISGWTRPPAMKYDELAAAKAATEELNANLTTHAREARERGLDPADVLEQRKRETEQMRRDGTTPARMPGAKVVIGDGGGGGEIGA